MSRKRGRSFMSRRMGSGIPPWLRLILVLGLLGLAFYAEVVKPHEAAIKDRLERLTRGWPLLGTEARRRRQLKPFKSVTPASDPRFFFPVADAFEAADVPRPMLSKEGVLVFQQIQALPAGKAADSMGIGMIDLYGSFGLEACLDLSLSTISSRSSVLAASIGVDWEHRFLIGLTYDPARQRVDCRTAPGGMVLPRGARELCLGLARVDSELSAYALIDTYGPYDLCRMPAPPITRPARQAEMMLWTMRPDGMRPDKPFKNAGQDVYLFPSFRLTCHDPAGCKARAWD